MTDKSPFLEMTNATVEINGHKILNKLSLLINTGEHAAIIGPNGSGKSTLIKLLTRQIYAREPQEGPPPIRLFGQELWNVRELRSSMGIVSTQVQRDFLNNIHQGRISGLNVVISGFFSSFSLFPHQTITGQMKEKAREMLEQMESEYLANYTLATMSSGEIQRVLIARALVTNPKVLVLDEPTTGLDMVARYQCMSKIRNIAQNGTSIILVTHHLDEVLPEIERVILLRNGEINQDGPKQKVLTSEHLSHVYGHPLSLTKRKGFYEIHLR